MSTIAANSAVSINYVLKDKDGTVLDKSEQEPLSYLHGHNNIIPGLEEALAGLKVGDKKSVHILPEAAYGLHDEDKRFEIPRQSLPDGDLQPGMVLELTPDSGPPFLARIAAITPDAVQVDANHPMAGKELFFDVEVMAVREASPEEVAHGHVHGPGGHHHHH